MASAPRPHSGSDEVRLAMTERTEHRLIHIPAGEVARGTEILRFVAGLALRALLGSRYSVGKSPRRVVHLEGCLALSPRDGERSRSVRYLQVTSRHIHVNQVRAVVAFLAGFFRVTRPA